MDFEGNEDTDALAIDSIDALSSCVICIIELLRKAAAATEMEPEL